MKQIEEGEATTSSRPRGATVGIRISCSGQTLLYNLIVAERAKAAPSRPGSGERITPRGKVRPGRVAPPRGARGAETEPPAAPAPPGRRSLRRRRSRPASVGRHRNEHAANPDRRFGLLLSALASWRVLSRALAGGARARVLRRALPHRRTQQSVLPAAPRRNLRRLEPARAGRLRLRGERQPLYHPHPAAACGGPGAAAVPAAGGEARRQTRADPLSVPLGLAHQSRAPGVVLAAAAAAAAIRL